MFLHNVTISSLLDSLQKFSTSDLTVFFFVLWEANSEKQNTTLSLKVHYVDSQTSYNHFALLQLRAETFEMARSKSINIIVRN